MEVKEFDRIGAENIPVILTKEGNIPILEVGSKIAIRFGETYLIYPPIKVVESIEVYKQKPTK